MKNSDRILAISAIFVSACALAVSIYQTRILSMEKDAAVWPYLRVGTSWTDEQFILSVSNDGIGPAIIQDVTYTLGDTTFHMIHQVARHLIEQDTILKNNVDDISYSNIESEGTAMRAGESTNILQISKVSNEVIKRIQNYMYTEKIKIKIDYCSIYNKCWRNQDNEMLELD